MVQKINGHLYKMANSGSLLSSSDATFKLCGCLESVRFVITTHSTPVPCAMMAMEVDT